MSSRHAMARRPCKPRIQSDIKHTHLRAFQKQYLGIENFDATEAKLGESFFLALSNVSYDLAPSDLCWRSTIPSRLALLRTEFGRPSPSHSFMQVPCLDTCGHLVLRSGFLDPCALLSWFECSPKLCHLAASMVAYRSYDFRWIREYNQHWEQQSELDPDRQVAYTSL